MVDGRTFKGPDELKTILMADKDAFARCVADKMLIYALGRGTTRADRPAIKEIADQLAIIKIADLVTTEDFYNERHALIFAAILDLYEKREPLDLLTLSNKLREVGELDNVGGSVYLADLTGARPGQGPHTRSGGGVPHRRIRAAARAVRRSQHPAP